MDRAEKAEPHRHKIIELLALCRGNLVRVHEELAADDCHLSYQALTAFCRRHGIGKKRKPRAGRYHFDPGQEMQHDTSPHKVRIGGRVRLAHAASLVFCYSRRKYFQYYPFFDRFHCKLFLSEAVQYFGGSCRQCMIDNTHVVVLKGTGPSMIPVPEMEAFGRHFDFEFVAHEKGDANRSARVERLFHHIENNFLAGREATDWDDLNQQAITWCDKDNARYRRHLGASPQDLFASERESLVALPDWVPEVYRLQHRIVSIEGYVAVSTNRYSVPLDVPVGRQLEVRETKDRVDIYEGPRMIASHKRILERLCKRVMDPSHRSHRTQRRPEVPCEERRIIEQAPDLTSYVAALKARRHGSTIRQLRQLLSMLNDYPLEQLLAAFSEAEHYGLFDLERVERMILKRLATDFFTLPDDATGDTDDE